MDLTGIYNDTLIEIEQWFTQDSSAEFIEYNGLFLIVFAVFLVGVWMYCRAAKASSKLALEAQQSSKIAKEQEKIKGFLQALHVESKIIFEKYQHSIGNELENLTENTAFQLSCSLNKDCAYIYQTNIGLIPAVTNSALRLQIVKAYTLFNCLQAALKYHQTQYNQYIEMQSKAQISDKPIELNRAQQELNKLKVQTTQLKQDHLLMVTQMQQMLSMLRVYRLDKKES